MTLTDNELVQNIKAEIDCNESILELARRHHGIVEKAVSNSTRDYQKIADTVSDAKVFIHDLSKTFNSEKSKFHTYLFNSVRFATLKAKRKSSRYYSIFDTFDCLDDNYDTVMDVTIAEKIDEVKELIAVALNESERGILEKRYFSSENGKLPTWKSIAASLNRNPKDCMKEHDVAIKKIKEEFECRNNPPKTTSRLENSRSYVAMIC